MRKTGTCKWFDAQKGYGFIKPDGEAQDVFVHITALQAAGLPGLETDAEVSFDVVMGRNGRSQAANITLL